MNWLQKIRKKPKAVRRQILYITTFVFGGIIVLFWAFTLPYRFKDIKQEEVKEALRPFNVIKDAFVDTYNKTKNSLNQLNYGQ